MEKQEVKDYRYYKIPGELLQFRVIKNDEDMIFFDIPYEAQIVGGEGRIYV